MGGGCTTIRFGTPGGVETPRADVSTCVGCSWLVRNDVRGVGVRILVYLWYVLVYDCWLINF